MVQVSPITLAAIRASQNYGEALKTHERVDRILKNSLIGFTSGLAECQCKNLTYLVIKSSSQPPSDLFKSDEDGSLLSSADDEDLTKVLAATAVGSAAGALVECTRCFMDDDNNENKMNCLVEKSVEGLIGMSCAVVGEAVVTAFGVQGVGGVVGGMVCRGLLQKVMKKEDAWQGLKSFSAVQLF